MKYRICSSWPLHSFFLSIIIIVESLVKEKGLHAGKFIKELAPLFKGGGGGQDF